jgi:subfamily B ATP-binding cassette protein HlyB/CyaB
VNELCQYYVEVLQETVLFAKTVKENLMASSHADFEDVIQVCRIAEFHDVIEKMPQGHQTWLGEHGVGLSGREISPGDRTSVAETPVSSYFDEATSGLNQTTTE